MEKDSDAFLTFGGEVKDLSKWGSIFYFAYPKIGMITSVVATIQNSLLFGGDSILAIEIDGTLMDNIIIPLNSTEGTTIKIIPENQNIINKIGQKLSVRVLGTNTSPVYANLTFTII